MGAILRRYPFLIVLAVVAGVLAAIVAWELTAHVGSGSALGARPSRRAAPFDAKLLPPPTVVQAEQQYPEFAARPLWTPTRRPAPAAAPPSTYTPGQFVLQGVIVVGKERTAMLREKSSGKLHRVEAGKQVNGITVAEISPESVTLTQGTDREVLPLQVQKGVATPTVGGVPVQGMPQTGAGPAPPQAAHNVQGSGGPFGAAAGPFSAGTPPAHVPAPPVTPPGVLPPNAPEATFGPAPGPAANPFQAPGGGATQPAAAVSAEELLARRRARRGQQSQ